MKSVLIEKGKILATLCQLSDDKLVPDVLKVVSEASILFPSGYKRKSSFM